MARTKAMDPLLRLRRRLLKERNFWVRCGPETTAYKLRAAGVHDAIRILDEMRARQRKERRR
jgi:hypothetical protein